jgi:hypothetical protein
MGGAYVGWPLSVSGMRRLTGALSVFLYSLLLMSCSKGEPTVKLTRTEAAAVAVDDSYRLATRKVESMHPDERELGELLELVGSDELRQAIAAYYLDAWSNSYDVNPEFQVLRQRVTTVSDTEVEIRTCLRYWSNLDYVDDPEFIRPPRGRYGYPQDSSRTWAMQEDGVWRLVALKSDREICDGFSTEPRSV